MMSVQGGDGQRVNIFKVVISDMKKKISRHKAGECTWRSCLTWSGFPNPYISELARVPLNVKILNRDMGVCAVVQLINWRISEETSCKEDLWLNRYIKVHYRKPGL